MGRARVFWSSAALEWAHLSANRAFVALTLLAALSLLVMVSLFGLTGSYAPVAVVRADRGPLVRHFLDSMAKAHHSFVLTEMSLEAAQKKLREGHLVGILKIPEDFSARIERGETSVVDIQVDNVNVDLTNDVQRALPDAIVANGKNFPGVRVQLEEHDVLPHDTGYIPYLVVSTLALDALLMAGILGALVTTREWELRTLKFLRLAPASRAAVLGGQLFVAASLAASALVLTGLVIIFGYGVVPVHAGAAAGALGVCVAIGVCLGAWVGAYLKRTLAVVPFMFGMMMPLYVNSGALEPSRFDGEFIWILSHLSPAYYAIGLLEWSFHGLHVTTEPVYLDLLILLGIAASAVAVTLLKLTRGRAK